VKLGSASRSWKSWVLEWKKSLRNLAIASACGESSGLGEAEGGQGLGPNPLQVPIENDVEVQVNTCNPNAVYILLIKDQLFRQTNEVLWITLCTLN